MGVTTTKTNKPFNPRGNDQSPLAYNRAKLYSGKALDFDGVNDVVNVTTNDLDFGASDFSVSAIVDWSGSHTDGKLAYAERSGSGSQLAAWQIRTDGSGNMIFQANTAAEGWQDVTFSGVEAIIADGLTHLTFVRVGTGVTLYINGVFYSTGTGSIQATLDTPNGAFAIGNRINSSNYWNGKITQYKVYSTALTAAQIADLYNNPEKIVPTGVDNTALKLWLPMMESAGTTAYDGSGNGNHGTISGATYVNGVGAPVAQTSVIDWNKGSNLVAYSEALNTSNYFSGIRILFESNQSAPNGTTDAMRLKSSTSGTNTNAYIIRGGISGYAGQTISAFFKADEITEVLLFSNGGAGVYFDIEDGSFISYFENSANIDSYDIKDFGGGWRRYSITFNTAVSDIQILFAKNGNYIADYTINEGLEVFGVCVGSVSYTPTIGTAQPTPVLLPQGLTTGRDITGVNLFENVRKQSALNLDGQSWAEVHDNASLDITDEVTLECWLYHTDTTNIEHIIGKRASSGNWLRIYSASTNTVRVERNGGASSSNVPITQNAWTHIVATIDSSDLVRLYINGTQLTSAFSFTPWGLDNAAPVSIGAWVTESGTPSFNSYETGQLAQPRIYNRALSAEEIQRNYNAGKNIYS